MGAAVPPGASRSWVLTSSSFSRSFTSSLSPPAATASPSSRSSRAMARSSKQQHWLRAEWMRHSWSRTSSWAEAGGTETSIGSGSTCGDGNAVGVAELTSAPRHEQVCVSPLGCASGQRLRTRLRSVGFAAVMMNSLVGYGLSSGSDSEEDAISRSPAGGSLRAASLTATTTITAQKTRNFLLESGSASSESDDDEPTRPSPRRAVTAPSPSALPRRQQQPPPPAPAPPPARSLPPQNKLPPPPLGACAGSGVFANPFKAQADHKLTVLQKHVPLTMQARPALIGGKRVCVAYRKDGRCRFGIKCKYAHDSDLQNPVAVPTLPPTDCSQETADSSGSPLAGHGHGRGEDEGQPGKKRRVGLSNTLVPPKRAMKQFARQRERDRTNAASSS
ncbi:hypothetical protein CRUP_025718 [Coryphaenoides rupestris]|nr:hypothetical protein CRUP_025718 [Coryphaenoides rupestris]